MYLFLRKLKSFLPLTLLCIAFLAVPVLIFSSTGMPRLRSLQEEVDRVKLENQQAERDVERLRAEIKSLREDPKAIMRVARNELGLVRKSEVVFQFPSPKPQKPNPNEGLK